MTARAHDDYPPIAASERWYARAVDLIPAGTQTLAKGRTQLVQGVLPRYLERGSGCRVWDVDGNEYVDLSMAIGPLSLGYAHPRVDAAIRAQLDSGITFSLPHPLEVQVAELVREVVPGAERVRFAKSGAEVTSAAVRLARAFTGRDVVLCCGYHGWHDWYIGTTDRHRGVPESTRERSFTFDYNDLGSLEAALDADVAAVILEPITFEEPRPGFLEGLRRACDRAGALLVFDEMWTGFRLALGGAQQRYGVRADLACFSKAVANGMPLSVLTGRGEVMDLLDEDVFFFSTFGGEALSLAAAQATIHELRERDVPGRLARAGAHLRGGLEAQLAGHSLRGARVAGPDCRTLLAFDPAAGDPLLQKSLVQQELCRRGVLWSGTHNLALAHTDGDLDLVLAAFDDALGCLGHALREGRLREAVRGVPLAPVFRRATGFHSRPRLAGAGR